MAGQATAQQAATIPNWQVARFGIAAGGDIDMPHHLDHGYLLSTAENVDFDASDLPFSEGELTKMNCDNGTFRLGLSFSPLRSPNTEWQFSLLSIDGRIDHVHYEMGTEGASDWQYLDVSATNKETAVEAVFLMRDQTKHLNFSGGLGTNVGYSHGGQVRVQGILLDDVISDNPATGQEFDLTYQQRDGINQRLFLQAGMGIRFLKRMEFGFEFRKGLGYRASFGGPTHFTILKRSLGFSLRCTLF